MNGDEREGPVENGGGGGGGEPCAMVSNGPPRQAISLGLSRITRLVERLFHQPGTSPLPPVIHLAGTNGKGSVSAYIDAGLRIGCGWRVGRFNSPHLVTVRDCVKINGETIASKEWATCGHLIEKQCNYVTREEGGDDMRPTAFERLTAQALLSFARAEPRLDVAVIETGLGGRLDATNVIPGKAKALTVITVIDLDHQSLLGTSIEAIAGEKAGIITQGTPLCIVAPQNYPSVLPIVQRQADGVGAKVISTSSSQHAWLQRGENGVPGRARFALPDGSSLQCKVPLRGEYQVDNLLTALTAIVSLSQSGKFYKDLLSRLTMDNIARGIEKTQWHGRLEEISLYNEPLGRKTSYLVDGAHNASAATELSRFLDAYLQRRRKAGTIHWIFASSRRGSDLRVILSGLFAHLDPRLRHILYAVGYDIPDQMPWISYASFNDIASAAPPGVQVKWATDVKEAQQCVASQLAATQQDNDGKDDPLVIICGSLYLVSDFYRKNNLSTD